MPPYSSFGLRFCAPTGAPHAANGRPAGGVRRAVHWTATILGFAFLALSGTSVRSWGSTSSAIEDVESEADSAEPAASPADLYLVVQDSGAPDPECPAVGDTVHVTIELGPTEVNVVGGQFLVRYDPLCLDFLTSRPGNACDPASPFVSTIFFFVDEAAGTLFYAVGVQPPSAGAPGPVTLACLTFVTRQECNSCEMCFDSRNPMSTRLSDRLGNPIDFVPHCSGPISTIPEVLRNCPPSVQAEATCSTKTAEVTWDPPEFIDGCEGILPLTCSATHSGGADLTGLIEMGGTLPVGVSTFCCMADNSCGLKEVCCWTVTVGAADDAQCDDANPCTVDFCDPADPTATPEGCVHVGNYDPDGDVFPPGGDGVVDVDDIVCVVYGFADFDLCPTGDISPCGGDGKINVDDLLDVLDAFGGVNDCPCP
jgi:hypothetical protein